MAEITVTINTAVFSVVLFLLLSLRERNWQAKPLEAQHHV